ncbi:MAG: serine hydrolase [Flavobacteriaceae bacterium]|nr:serine hydrolase [Flavobacteriaceae bacterium]
MKYIARVLLLIITVLLFYVVFSYPKLNILAGYSAKSMASSVFVANRSAEFTDANDNNFDLVAYGNDRVDLEAKVAYADAFKLLTRKGFYREGLGTVLALKDEDISKEYASPKRNKKLIEKPYPFGHQTPVDTIFENVDYDKLNAALDGLFDPKNKTRGAVVIYKDHLLTERYADGYDKNSKMLGWSMTKSITSTVFGILQYQGKLNVFEKAPVSAWQNDERREITIHNLLQMNSGLEWDEDYNNISDVTKMLFLERDMTQLQVKKPFVGKPNETWYYSSGTTNLLSGIFRKQFDTHQAYLNYWYAELIDKIGMHSMVLEADLAGNYVGSSYSWATPRDWAKFGLLYLHNGQWNGEVLFDEKWVDYATMPTPSSNGRYGAQIWLNKGGFHKGVPTSMYSFNGYQGQNVFIFPDQDLVIVRMSLTENADVDGFLKGVLSSIKQ